MLSTLEDGQLTELSAPMVISPLQQPLVSVIVSETQPPQDNVGFSSCTLHAVFITASPADTQIACLALHFPILVSGKHSQQGLKQNPTERRSLGIPQSESPSPQHKVFSTGS